MKFRRHFLACLVFASLPCGSALAHRDFIVQIRGDKLQGLPDKYQPAELSVKESRLRVGKRAMTFPPLMKGLFDQPYDLGVFASWYHDTKTFPPYLVLRIRPKKKDYSYDLVLSLETLDLIQLSVWLRESDSSKRVLPIALSEDEKEDFRKSVRTLGGGAENVPSAKPVQEGPRR